MSHIQYPNVSSQCSGGHIPQELFPHIIFYVDVQCTPAGRQANSRYLSRSPGEAAPDDIKSDLKQCSLVCNFWAERSRRFLFADKTLIIQCLDDAELFRKYTIQGCPRLTPLHQLIGRIWVQQQYAGRSFLHRLYLPVFQDKLRMLTIDGPVPDIFCRAYLDTPHWGLPPSVLLPPSFSRALQWVQLGDIHLPSFVHVTKYISHFSYATDVNFERLTWDGEKPKALPCTPSDVVRSYSRKSPRSMHISASDSSDNLHLALTAMLLNPACPLHLLSYKDRSSMVSLMRSFSDYEKDLGTSIGFDNSGLSTTMCMGHGFQVIFELMHSHTVMAAVGIYAHIDSYPFGAVIDSLRALLVGTGAPPSVRSIVISFPSFDHLQHNIGHIRSETSLEVLDEAHNLILVHFEGGISGGGKEVIGVGIDRGTLKPDGRIWKDLPRGNGWVKASEILRRQLRKDEHQ